MPQALDLGIKLVKALEQYVSPLDMSATVSIAIGGTAEVSIPVSAGERYLIKQVNITKGANVTVATAGITIDGQETKRTASTDLSSTYGVNISADGSVKVSGSNSASATTAENLTIQIIGYKVEREASGNEDK